jgi:uncharacterized protein (UPF0548 family)
MFLLNEPSVDRIREFISSQTNSSFSYNEVGFSRNGAPSGYMIDHNRIKLGEGEEVYSRAVSAIERWKMFDLGWVRLFWPYTPIEVGSTVAVLIGHLSFWSLNATRIVYLIDEDGPVRRFGFAYGTLLNHAERGEERFSVEWRRDDNSVWYDLFAFSKPNHLLAKAGYPLSRTLQKRFARDSKQAMFKAVNSNIEEDVR